jgi:hypothetical protein
MASVKPRINATAPAEAVERRPDADLRRRKKDKTSARLARTQPEEEEEDEPVNWYAVGVVVAIIIGLIGWIIWEIVDHFSEHDAVLAHVEKMKHEASQLILHEADYRTAGELARKAAEMAPLHENLEFYASILLGLHNHTAALALYRQVFVYSTSLITFQRYLTVLHRLGLDEERDQVWNVITLPEHRLSPWLTVWQCPDRVEESLLPGAKPLHDPEDYRVTRKITAAMPKIVQEFKTYLNASKHKGFIANQDLDIVPDLDEKAWTELLLFERGQWDYRLCSIGMPFHNTCKALRGLPEIEGTYRGYRAGQVSFLRLRPGTHLSAHYGSVNWRLVASCGVIVPENVHLRVGQEDTQWKENECLVFDDSFLHEVWHNGTSDRYVLFANFLVVEPEG